MIYRRTLILGALAVAACKDDSKTPVIGTNPALSGWQFLYSPGMPAQPTPLGTGFIFDFPRSDGVHYLEMPIGGSLIGQTAIKAKFSVVGAESLQVVASPEPSGVPARLKLFMQRRGDDLSAVGPLEFYRWWSVAYVELTIPGDHEIMAPLTQDAWTSVYGKRGDEPAAQGYYQQALGDLAAIGMTFGGTFAGHGVYATGPARFTLASFDIL